MPAAQDPGAPSGLTLTNSLTRRIEPFRPLRPPQVSVYLCGPTVYNHVHIGNWSTAIAADVLVRWLRESGYDVTYVQNITDVEDKIIRDSREAGMAMADFTKQWADVWMAGAGALDCLAAIDHLPRATEHVDGMVSMIQSLLDSGHAYLAEDGSIYYRIASFPTYGELANLKQEDLRAGASGRVSADEYDKDHIADFALWKGYVDDDGDVSWEPTFTVEGAPRVVKGRPGWHIECSVMSSAILGNRIDIHMGGEDLLFPHHQNEIAQSEAATGEAPFVGYWLHRRFLRVNGQKMSKSLKNFYTLEDIRERAGDDGVQGFRYLVATSHYRHAMDFTWGELDRALRSLKGLREDAARFRKHAGDAGASSFAAAFDARFTAAMNDDLSTATAIAAVYDAVRDGNRAAQGDTLSPGDAAAVVALLERADRVMGLGLAEEEVALPPEAQALLDARAKARADRDWAASDRLRDELLALGFAVKDGKDGQEVRPA